MGDQDLIRSAVRQIMHSSPAEARWQRLVEGGFLSLTADIPANFDLLRVVSEEIGVVGQALPWATCAVPVGALLSQSKAAFAATALAQFVSGELSFAIAPLLAPIAPEPRWKHVRASLSNGLYYLSGLSRGIASGARAERVIVEAECDDGTSALFLVACGGGSCEARRYREVDGSYTIEVQFDSLEVARDHHIFDGNDLVQGAIVRIAVALVAEASGALESLLALSRQHVQSRKQFGQSLDAFQVVQHRLAEMAMRLEEVRAAATLPAFDPAYSIDAQLGATSAAYVKTVSCARFVWQQAIQLHGAMGMTADCAIHPFIKRLMVIERAFGSPANHASRYGQQLAAVTGGACDAIQHVPFRDSVQTFLRTSLTPEMQASEKSSVGFVVDPAIGKLWHQALFRRGWIASNWPVTLGGIDWSPEQKYIFHLECERARAPHHNVMGLRMVGPLLMQHGTPEQKQKFLPRILSGDDYWCQGYSEPGSGSDLASVSTRATSNGDCYIVNGSKIWTTHAQFANWMFALVRTSTTESKHNALTFLLIEMDTPGIAISPIISIDGLSDLNQVFFDDVRVPMSNRVGEENHGWQVAMSLLELERGGGLASPELRAMHERIPKPENPFLFSRWSLIGIDIAIFESMELAGDRPGAQRLHRIYPSMLKLQASSIRQSLSELAVDCTSEDLWREGTIPNRWLADRAHTIFGGTTEIQKTIIFRALSD